MQLSCTIFITWKKKAIIVKRSAQSILISLKLNISTQARTHNYGQNFSDMDFFREFTGLSYQVMFRGMNKNQLYGSYLHRAFCTNITILDFQKMHNTTFYDLILPNTCFYHIIALFCILWILTLFKEIADMLKTNFETVRCWTKLEKLEAD